VNDSFHRSFYLLFYHDKDVHEGSDDLIL